MKHRAFYLLIFLFALALSGRAQNKPDNVCYISNNRIYFQLDKRWSESKKKEFSTLFSLDSSLIEQAFKDMSGFTVDSIAWQVSRINENIVELSKSIINNPVSYQKNDVFLLDDSWFMKTFAGIPLFSDEKKYGINKFSKSASISYVDGMARFSLTGKHKAGTVFLSGTFNNWSTMALKMNKTGTGWDADVKLTPGKYLYKFIVDGRWLHDENNLLKEGDSNNGYNSIFYCPNYLFELARYTEAKHVYVTGSFNGWKPKGLEMNHVKGGWQLPVYLEEGTYAYKFVVDGKWIVDPANSNTHADADGNLNSFMGIGDTLVFKLNGFKTAEKVILSGSFNNWSENELLMNRTSEGWELPYVIGAGNYEYKFIADGKWMPDPANPETTGEGNFANSCITVKPNYTFALKQFAYAKHVIVTGSFNGWREDRYEMIKKDGEWAYPVYLRPGKYTYKFIVDGNWMIDPANDQWEENSVGTGNSVLWIEP